ncbi:MAG: hypothetical protein RI918_1784, partial [Pseudomonadota bacterium]
MGSEPNFDETLLSAELRIFLNSDPTPFLARFNGDAFEFTCRNPLFPLGWAGDVGAGAARIDGYRHRHVHHVKLIDRFHAQVCKT